jgi:hypothetical protein
MHPASSVNEQRMNAAFTFFRRIMILGEMGDAEFKEHLNTAVTTLWLHNTPDKDREFASEFFYRAHHAENVVEAVREGEDAVKALEQYDEAMASRDPSEPVAPESCSFCGKTYGRCGPCWDEQEKIDNAIAPKEAPDA